jgi:hypothetical protein
LQDVAACEDELLRMNAVAMLPKLIGYGSHQLRVAARSGWL